MITDKELNECQYRLQMAQEAFLLASGEDMHSQQREAIVASLDAVMDLLTPHIGAQKLSTLRNLYGAIADIDAGRSAPLLTPTVRKSAKPIQDHVNKATASAVVDLFHKSGMSIREAAGLTVRSLPGFNMDANALLNFRKEVKSHRNRNDDVTRWYQDRLSEAEEFCPGDPAGAAIILLDSLKSEKV